MKLDKFTVKSQEAVQAAVAWRAEQFGNQEIQPEHLLCGAGAARRRCGSGFAEDGREPCRRPQRNPAAH